MRESPRTVYLQIEQELISGDLLKAQRTAESAASRFGANDRLWKAKFEVELARIYLYQGHTVEAASLLRQPLPPGAENNLAIEQSLLLSMAEARLGNVKGSRSAMAIAEALKPEGVLQAELQSVQGNIALGQSKLDEAEPLFNEALLDARRSGASFLQAQTLMNLGVIALQRDQYEIALARFHETSSIANSIGARQFVEKAEGNLGWTYYLTGDFARALDNANRAEAEAVALGAPLDELHLRRNAGMSQFQMNDLGAARASLERALTLAESLQNDQQTLNTHIALGYLLVHHQPELAKVHILEASRLAQLENDRDSDLEARFLSSVLLIEEGKPKDAESLLLSLIHRATEFPWLQWEIENTLAELYSGASEDRKADLWFQRAIATFHQERLTLKSVELELPFLENGSDLYLGYMEHLIHEGRPDEALAVLDSSRAEALAEGLGTSSATGAGLKLIPKPGPPSARALAARLHATILVYCLRPQTSYLWAINAAHTSFYKLPGSATILPLVARHTQAILTSKDLLAQKDDTGQQLYNALIQPAESTIAHGGRIYLIVDKGLGGLNFETLIPPGEQPHYWIEDVTITNARSLRLLAASKKATRGPRKLLLVGDPVYRAGDFPALPNAASEMTGVASHFAADARTIASGANASAATYTADDPGKFAYIHFVAHATANETNPLDSAIILSTPPNTPAGPAANRLYARDILQKPLAADLVTISSCYGSGTRNYSGEGVVGLVWAFLRAGAHSVIGASWEVSDISTPQLMDALYTRLLSGDQPDEALRSGKLAMIRGDGIYRKPLYWASFQLYAGR